MPFKKTRFFPLYVEYVDEIFNLHPHIPHMSIIRIFRIFRIRMANPKSCTQRLMWKVKIGMKSSRSVSEDFMEFSQISVFLDNRWSSELAQKLILFCDRRLISETCDEGDGASSSLRAVVGIKLLFLSWLPRHCT